MTFTKFLQEMILLRIMQKVPRDTLRVPRDQKKLGTPGHEINLF